MSGSHGSRLFSHIAGLRSRCISRSCTHLPQRTIHFPILRHYASRKAIPKPEEHTETQLEQIPDPIADPLLETSTSTDEPSKLRRTRKPRTATPPPPKVPLISPGSHHHSDLASFQAYASRVNLPPTTNVYIGTHYEYTVAASLSRLSLSLTRVGRTSDLGIDLLGTWKIPSLPEPLRVLVQCKAEAPRPTMIRELEGAVVGAPAGWRGQGVVALLAARDEATKGVREAVRRSGMPMGFVNVTGGGVIRQFIWNAAAVERGLEGVGVTVKYPVDDNKEPEITLTWEGKPWKS